MDEGVQTINKESPTLGFSYDRLLLHRYPVGGGHTGPYPAPPGPPQGAYHQYAGYGAPVGHQTGPTGPGPSTVPVPQPRSVAPHPQTPQHGPPPHAAHHHYLAQQAEVHAHQVSFLLDSSSRPL